MNYNRKNKIKMWYKVQELTEQGYNKSQIKLKTGLDRATVRRYQQIDEEAFHNWIQQKRNLPKKLFQYKNYVKEILGKTPYLSAAQVEDWLKEKHDDLPDVHSKTVYNYVQSIREQFNIPKPIQNKTRQFEKLAETAYGQEAQVDFGEAWMQTKQGNLILTFIVREGYRTAKYAWQSPLEYHYIQLKHEYTSTLLGVKGALAVN